MQVLFNRKFLNYNETSKYEGAYRLNGFFQHYPDYEINDNPKEDILRVHSERYYNKIKQACKNKNELVGLHLTPELFEIAHLAVSFAIEASKSNNFAIIRPPGHHASYDKASGFCIFNNMAIAVTKLISEGKKVAVLDIDGHHGDGTQKLLESKDSVLFCSIHEQDVFPGTGLESRNNYINFPLKKPITAEVYLETLDKCIHKIKLFNPDILGLSIGFDTYEKDTLLDFGLNANSYRTIGAELRMNFNHIFALLEGGYHNDILPCVQAFVSGVNSVIE